MSEDDLSKMTVADRRGVRKNSIVNIRSARMNYGLLARMTTNPIKKASHRISQIDCTVAIWKYQLLRMLSL